MIWTLRVECIYGEYLEEDCVRVFETPSTTSLLDLHEAILEAVGFDNDHLFAFFAGRNWRHRKLVFNDSCEEWEESRAVYSNTTLEQVYPLPKGLRLFYRFDFGDNWAFAIRKSAKKPTAPQPGISYPRVIEAIGPNPPQYGPPMED